MASAAFSIGGGSSLAMYEATAAEVVTIALDSTDGVRSSSVSVLATDETSVKADWVIASSTATSTTVTCPNATGVACLIEWRVNGGSITGSDGQTTSADLIKRAKIVIPTASGGIVIVPGETTETDGTYGWAGPINEVIRTGGVAIGDGTVTNAKLADMAQATIKGRASGAGTGAPQDLTATQARTILNVEDGADVTDFANVSTALAAASSAVDFNAQRLTDVANPTSAQDAVTLAYLQANAQAVMEREGTLDLNAAQAWADLGAAFTIDASTTRYFEMVVHVSHPDATYSAEVLSARQYVSRRIGFTVTRNATTTVTISQRDGTSSTTGWPLSRIDIRAQADGASGWKLQIQRATVGADASVTGTVLARVWELTEDAWAGASTVVFEDDTDSSAGSSYTFGDGLTEAAGDVDIDTTDTTVFASTATGNRVVLRDANADTAVRYLTAERINGTSNTVQINGSTEVETNCGVYDLNATSATIDTSSTCAITAGGALTIAGTTVGIDGTGAMSLGTTNQTGLTAGRSGANTTINGNNTTINAAAAVTLAPTGALLIQPGQYVQSNVSYWALRPSSRIAWIEESGSVQRFWFRIPADVAVSSATTTTITTFTPTARASTYRVVLKAYDASGNARTWSVEVDALLFGGAAVLSASPPSGAAATRTIGSQVAGTLTIDTSTTTVRVRYVSTDATALTVTCTVEEIL